MDNKKEIDSSNRKLATLEKVDLGYGNRIVLRDFDLVLTQGDFLGIVGPNGCGKTTVLKALLGILRPLKGRVWRDLVVRLGYVPQRQFIDEIYPLTVAEVAMMGYFPHMGIISRPSKKDKDFIIQCLDHVGIADLAGRLFQELSGGQKQRTLIARALASEPNALILDEPTNDMDISSEYAIMELLRQFHSEDGLTVVMVSHLLNVVVNYAQQLALLNGDIRLIGPTEQVLSSENLTKLYGIPVEVANFKGQNVVLTRGGG